MVCTVSIKIPNDLETPNDPFTRQESAKNSTFPPQLSIRDFSLSFSGLCPFVKKLILPFFTKHNCVSPHHAIVRIESFLLFSSISLFVNKQRQDVDPLLIDYFELKLKHKHKIFLINL
jgi:hypothetical protein